MPNIRLPVPLLLVITGLPGLLVLPFVLPELPGVPRAALLVNPAILLAIAAVAGTPAAKRSGLRLRSPDATVAGRLFELGAGALLAWPSRQPTTSDASGGRLRPGGRAPS